MDVLADGRCLGDRFDDGVSEVLRVRAREANPLDAVDGAGGAEQLAELGLDLDRQLANLLDALGVEAAPGMFQRGGGPGWKA